MNCRHCHSPLKLNFVDLGTAPPSNAYLTSSQLTMPEKYYPLRVLVCEICWLVQTEDYAGANELFDAEYAYFSSYSSSWLAHAKKYVDDMMARLSLGPDSLVVEIAANDGYLLQYVKERNLPCYGIEPTHSTAKAAIEKGIAIIEEFFTVSLAEKLNREGKAADLMIANNVLAHVPDVNDFVSAFAKLLKPRGVATFEFPHLAKLIEGKQFDTIYHEHYSYLSLSTVQKIFAANGLSVFDVEVLTTHGGSLRVYAQRLDTCIHAITPNIKNILDYENSVGLSKSECYLGLQIDAEKIKDDFLTFLIDTKRKGRTVGAYGAAAKGNTILNFSGIRHDLLPFVVDRNKHKQGKYLPGSRIPIVNEEYLRATRPDYLVLLPWNLKAELIDQLSYIREWDGRFVTVVPKLEVI